MQFSKNLFPYNRKTRKNPSHTVDQDFGHALSPRGLLPRASSIHNGQIEMHNLSRTDVQTLGTSSMNGLNKRGYLLDQNLRCDVLASIRVLDHEIQVTRYLLDSISKINKIKLYLPCDKNVLGIVSFSVDGYLSDDVSSILSEEFNILVRSGYHCSPFVHEFIGSEESKGS